MCRTVDIVAAEPRLVDPRVVAAHDVVVSWHDCRGYGREEVDMRCEHQEQARADPLTREVNLHTLTHCMRWNLLLPLYVVDNSESNIAAPSSGTAAHLIVDNGEDHRTTTELYRGRCSSHAKLAVAEATRPGG